MDANATAADAWVATGLALLAARRLPEACTAFERAIEIQPDNVSAHVNHAGILRQLGRPREALAASDRAIALQPDFAPAHCNRGLALNDLDRPMEAIQCYDRALVLDPGFVAAHGNRGKALQALNQPKEALAAYQRVIALQPHAAQAHVNASHTHLLLGEFERGWALYEWRKHLPSPLGNRYPTKVPWLGASAIAGRTLLLHWEQGLGDTIQFSRYAKLAKARGARVILMVQRNLARLMGTLDPDIEVCTDEPPPNDVEHHCPLLSLPLAFGTRPDSIPAPIPYLFAEPGRVARWRKQIDGPEFKIGINWQGNRQSPADRGRSFALELFRDIAQLPHVRLISLQVGPGAEQLHMLPRGMSVESPGDDFDAGPDGFLDSAAALKSLDLIITSDTALAHLAGALGCPTWLVLQYAADWRWLRERADCPWYPSMRLFRQTQRGRWQEPFSAMHQELASRPGGK
jgi:hypothetical protein